MTALTWIALSAAGVLAVSGLAWVFWPAPASDAATDDVTRSAEANGVTVTATWLAAGGRDETRFRVVLDTHTVDLSTYDFASSSFLETANGLRVGLVRDPDVASSGSHHVEADLAFPFASRPFALAFEDLGGVPDRRIEFG